MTNPVKSYFLVPCFEWSPQTIKLGSLITNKDQPDNRFIKTPIPIDNDYVTKTSRTYSETIRREANYGTGIFAKFSEYILPFGIKAVFGKETNNDLKIETSNLSTEYFTPYPEYLQQSLADAAVQDYIEPPSFGSGSKRLYMITGIKTAEKVKITTNEGSGFRIELGSNTELEGRFRARAVQIGPSISMKTNDTRNATSVAQETIIIGYQLSEIIKKSDEVIEAERIYKGTLLSGKQPHFGLERGYTLRLCNDGHGTDDTNRENSEFVD